MGQNTLYDEDLVAWTEKQADALHRRAANEIDWDNVAEEIESLGRSERNELRSRIRTILDHLIRLQTSPAPEPTRGWRRTVVEQRAQLEDVLKESPSLKPKVADIIAEELPKAHVLAALALEEYGEHPRVDPAALSFTADQVLGSWLP